MQWKCIEISKRSSNVQFGRHFPKNNPQISGTFFIPRGYYYPIMVGEALAISHSKGAIIATALGINAVDTDLIVIQQDHGLEYTAFRNINGPGR